jgi:hypothetical protein
MKHRGKATFFFFFSRKGRGRAADKQKGMHSINYNGGQSRPEKFYSRVEATTDTSRTLECYDTTNAAST